MRRTEEFAKNFVLARTTNQREYLKDKTGERRFLPILVNKDKQVKHPMEMKEEVVKQIWGEAVTLYKNGHPLMFGDDTEEELNKYRERFMYRDEVEIQVIDYLDMPVPKEWDSWSIQKQHQYTQRYFDNDSELEKGDSKMSKVSTREIMYNLFMRNSSDRKLSRKISIIVDGLPEWEKRPFKRNGKVFKGYIRNEDYSE